MGKPDKSTAIAVQEYAIHKNGGGYKMMPGNEEAAQLFFGADQQIADIYIQELGDGVEVFYGGLVGVGTPAGDGGNSFAQVSCKFFTCLSFFYKQHF